MESSILGRSITNRLLDSAETSTENGFLYAPLRKLIFPVFLLGGALYSPVLLAGFSFTSDQSTHSFADDSKAHFTFSIAPSSVTQNQVTLETFSYSGGTNAAGQQIPSGGFDPIISVFDSQGALVADNDDGGPGYDALLMLDLTAGEYDAILTEFSNFYNSEENAFPGSGSTSIASGYKTADWALDILGVDNAAFVGLTDWAPSPTPEPEPEPTPPPQEEIDDALQGIAINANTSSTATTISTACPRSAVGSRFREDCTPVVVGAFQPSGSQANNQATFALAAVTAEQATVPVSSSRASLGTQRQNLSTRLSALRGGATGINLRGLSAILGGEDEFGQLMAGSPLYDGLARGGAASADDASLSAFDSERLGAFFNGNVSRADKDPTSNEEGFDSDSWAITAGVDYRFRDDLVIGIAGGYNNADTDIDNNGGSLNADGYSVSLYGTYFRGENLYLDGIVTYGNNNYDQKRNIRYLVGNTAISQTASADYDGDQWSASLGGGYSLSSGPWSYGPTARIEYVNADVDGYSESISNPNANGGAWAARLDDLSQDSFTSNIGVDVARAFSTSWGVVLPQLHLGWIHEFKDNAQTVNGSFILDPTQSVFDITSDRPDSDYFNARLGVSAQFAGGASGFLYYNKVFGYRNLDVDSLGAGVRLAF